MKKMFCLALAALLMLSPALAAPQLSDSLFVAAKQAAQCLMTGDYDRLTTLPFSGDAPDADEWASFAANYRTEGYAQQDYAVGYWLNESWRVAVPLRDPDSPDVEVLLLDSEDGYAFSGYRYADWGQVAQECAISRSYVSRIEKRALEKLRAAFARDDP
ncbi:MAG: sigma factor-like helix-turn-helix DNA-binding protein [Bacteroidales bacterium]